MGWGTVRRHGKPVICPVSPFSRCQKPQTPGFLEENRGFVFVECGGEGETFHRATLKPINTGLTGYQPPFCYKILLQNGEKKGSLIGWNILENHP